MPNPTVDAPDATDAVSDLQDVVRALLRTGIALWEALDECGVAEEQRDEWDVAEARAIAALDRLAESGGDRGQ